MLATDMTASGSPEEKLRYKNCIIYHDQSSMLLVDIGSF